MNVSQFFEQLSYGALSNLSMSTEVPGEIRAGDQPKLISHMNYVLGLLHTRFLCRRDFLTVEITDGRLKYPLQYIHAVSDTDVGNTEDRFIQDSAEVPFQDNLLKIIGVYDADGLPFRLNEEGNQLSIRTLAYDELLLPAPGTYQTTSQQSTADEDPFGVGTLLTVEYQAKHAKLSNPVVLTEAITLSPALHPALEAGVAARVYHSMSGEPNVARGAKFDADYERICLTVAFEDMLQATSTGMLNRFNERGYV